MRTKLTLIFITAFLSLALLGLYLVPSTPPAKGIDLKVIKVDGVWKVVDATDYSKTTVKVNKKDKITWTVVGTDASFQFPENLLDPVDTTDNLKDGYTKSLKDGHTLKLKIKDNVKAGTYDYSVYCTADEVFAVGSSPPRIIVE
jgi:hypothetical protein